MRLPPQRTSRGRALARVTLSNQVLNYEVSYFNINVNTTLVNAQTITPTSRTSKTITFTWNTTGLSRGNYTLSAYAEPVSLEINTSDRNVAHATVFLRLLLMASAMYSGV